MCIRDRFLTVGVVYDRMHSRLISTYGGLVSVIPKYSILFMLFALASLGLPGTSGFIGEFLILMGAFKDNFLVAVIAIIFTSFIALMQEDMKKLIAYSSVAHMGFVTLGIFTLQQQGIEGSIIQMISHGLVSAALFLCVGVVYDLSLIHI